VDPGPGDEPHLAPEAAVVWVGDPEPTDGLHREVVAGDRGVVVDQLDAGTVVVTMNGNNTFVAATSSIRRA